jgi:hypothetical protein
MKRKLGIGRLGAALLSALLAACADRGIEDPTLNLAQFDSPLTLSAQLSIEPVNGRFEDEENAALVALAAEAGFVEIEPNAEAGPYWRFVVRDAERQADTLTFRAAHREAVRRTDWSLEEGERTQVQSENIAYMVRFDDRFGAPRELGPFTVHMVVERASRSQQWRIRERSYPNHDPRQERAMLRALGVEMGRPFLPTLAARITAAQAAAYAAIETEFVRSGRLARGDAQHTISIPAAGLMFWTQAPPRTLTREGASAYCHNASVERSGRRPYDDWRLPTRAEFATALDGDGFADTPDGRIWRDIAHAPRAGSMIQFAVNDPQGDYFLHATGEVLRAREPDPEAEEDEEEEDPLPPPRLAGVRVLCVRNAA